MKCPSYGVGHSLIMPNLEIIYRDSCDETVPIITEMSGMTGLCNKRIITIPCNGCDKCRGIKSYGCRIKDCSLEDGRNTKIRSPVLLNLGETGCETFISNVEGDDPYSTVADFSAFVCSNLGLLGATGLNMFGDLIISGPLPAFEQPYVIATIQNGQCIIPTLIPFTAGLYRLENCGGTTFITIENNTML